MKITITGATGFVGKSLQRYLTEKQVDVVPLSLRNTNWKRELSRDSDAIIHLAGKAHDIANTSAESEYFEVNHDLTIALFDAYVNSDTRDFIFFSSVKAVADTVERVLYEDDHANPLTPYGRSKLKAEEYILSKTLPIGKRVFIIRPCMIHGPGNKGNLNLLYKIVEKDFPWPLAAFSNRRSFLSIDNLNYITERLVADKKIKSGVYNVADDESLSTNDLVILISNILGRKARLWHIPESLIRGSARIGDILPMPLNSERLKKLTESYVVSNGKIKNALGIDRLPVSVIDGLKKTIRSFSR